MKLSSASSPTLNRSVASPCTSLHRRLVLTSVSQSRSKNGHLVPNNSSWQKAVLRYFGLPPAQPLRLTLVDPTDRYLRTWKPVPSCLQFDQQRVLSRFFCLLLPLPTAAFSTIMAKRKVTAEEPLARAESNGYKKGAHRF
jgi:hypothetical protein